MEQEPYFSVSSESCFTPRSPRAPGRRGRVLIPVRIAHRYEDRRSPKTQSDPGRQTGTWGIRRRGTGETWGDTERRDPKGPTFDYTVGVGWKSHLGHWKCTFRYGGIEPHVLRGRCWNGWSPEPVGSGPSRCERGSGDDDDTGKEGEGSSGRDMGGDSSVETVFECKGNRCGAVELGNVRLRTMTDYTAEGRVDSFTPGRTRSRGPPGHPQRVLHAPVVDTSGPSPRG